MFSEVSLYTEFKTVGTTLHMVTPASILKVPRTPCALLLFINLIFVRPIDWSATCDFAAIYMHSYNTRYRSATMSHVSNSLFVFYDVALKPYRSFPFEITFCYWT